MIETNRGQSEVAGTVLLLGMLVIVLTAFGVVVLDSFDTQERQLTEISVSVTTTSVNVTHTGGEPIAATDLTAVVSFDGRSEQYNADETGVGGSFTVGDQWILDSGLPYAETDDGEYVSVTVIARNTGEILYAESIRIV